MTMERQEFKPTLIRGESSALEPKPLKTEDIIIPSSNTYVEQLVQQEVEETEEEKAQKAQELEAEIIQNAIDSKTQALDGWLAFKVKNELLVQIYKAAGEDNDIDVNKIQEVVVSELATVKNENLAQAEHLHDIMPAIAVRRGPARGGNDYFDQDINNMERRITVHYGVVEYIDALEAAGDEDILDLTQSMIEQHELKVRKEVLKIFVQQKKELENALEVSNDNNTRSEKRIIELKGAIVTLKEEVALANEDRDESEIVHDDRELTTARLTQDAKDLAL